MKKIALFLFLAISTYGFSQQTATREKKLAPKDTLIRDTIVFDGLTGIPNKNRVYVPFNSWIAITVKNVNPFKSVPKTELLFTNLDFGKTNDIPSLLDLVKSPAENKPINEPASDKTEKAEATKDKFDVNL